MLSPSLILYSPGDGLGVATVASLASAATTPAGIAIISLGLAGQLFKWIFDIYQNTYVCGQGLGRHADYTFSPGNVACVMAYIADLTIVMHRLSSTELSEERVVTILTDYAKSKAISQVHNDIRKFVKDIPTLRLKDKDHALDEIIRLIEKHRVQVPQT